MTIPATNILDCVVYQYEPKLDRRGSFGELYNTNHQLDIKQINCSTSHKNVFRGIHKASFAKLVSCVYGSIIDFCIDLRPDSPTYLTSYSLVLTPSNGYQLYIPEYCGHGFFALENSIVIYGQNDTYSPEKDQTYCYKQFHLSLPTDSLILSNKDMC